MGGYCSGKWQCKCCGQGEALIHATHNKGKHKFSSFFYACMHACCCDIEEQEGYTPAMRAALEGHLAMMQVLVKTGADMNVSDKVNVAVLCWRWLRNVVQCYAMLGRVLLCHIALVYIYDCTRFHDYIHASPGNIFTC